MNSFVASVVLAATLLGAISSAHARATFTGPAVPLTQTVLVDEGSIPVAKY
jgi:hypothetical protein